MLTDAEEILNFWFYEVGPDHWFDENPDLDKTVRTRFLQTYERAALDGLREWEGTPEGMLALLLLLDIFPRRMFRDTAKAFDTDETSLDLARQAIINHFDDRIDKTYKLFFYLPFMHSEHLGDQRLGGFYMRERTKEEDWVDSANWCYDVIERFGRFPHRNKALGRESSAEEEAFLREKHDRKLV